MATKYVLFNEEMGVYLGNAMGLGFWSKLDPVGQDSAVVFDTEKEALNHVASWDTAPKEQIAVRAVECADSRYATEAEVMAAGMPGWRD